MGYVNKGFVKNIKVKGLHREQQFLKSKKNFKKLNTTYFFKLSFYVFFYFK